MCGASPRPCALETSQSGFVHSSQIEVNCVSAQDRIEERRSRYLPQLIMVSPSSHVPGDLGVKEAEAPPSKKRAFDDLDGENTIVVRDCCADSLVHLARQPASSHTGE